MPGEKILGSAERVDITDGFRYSEKEHVTFLLLSLKNVFRYHFPYSTTKFAIFSCLVFYYYLLLFKF